MVKSFCICCNRQGKTNQGSGCLTCDESLEAINNGFDNLLHYSPVEKIQSKIERDYVKYPRKKEKKNSKVIAMTVVS